MNARPGRTNTEKLIEVKHLHKSFPIPGSLLFRRKKHFQVLKDLNLTIYTGETIGLVGESGSGKSTLAECIGGLQSIPANSVYYKGVPLEKLSGDAYKAYRRNVQFVFQSPYDTLNPRMTVAQIIREPMRIQKMFRTKNEEDAAINDLLHDVGLDPSFMHAFPGQLSGGQCQRVAIARALSLKPELIICDEAVSALDVSVQATILNLLQDLKQKYDVSYLFISHDLGVVRSIADRVIVLKNGEIVEEGRTEEVFHHPKESYTKELLAAIPE